MTGVYCRGHTNKFCRVKGKLSLNFSNNNEYLQISKIGFLSGFDNWPNLRLQPAFYK